MFDLEDAVALREKDTARLLVFHALQHPMYQDIETVVRINPLSTPFGLLDLEAAVHGGVDVIRLPKTGGHLRAGRPPGAYRTRVRARSGVDPRHGGD